MCQICDKKLTPSKSPGLQCSGLCKLFFHATCVGLQIKDLQLLNSEGMTWTCSTCREQPGSPNKSIIINSDENYEPSDLKQIYAMLGDINDRLKNYETLLESVKFCSDKITDFENKLSVLSDKCKAIESLKKDVELLKTETTEYKIRCSDLEQRSRMDNVEISGVPEKNNENINVIIENIGKYINCPIGLQDYCIAHRVQKINSKATTPRNIIVKFLSRQKKNEILAASKKVKKSTSAGYPGLKIPNIGDSVFINEHLTSTNKLLLKMAKAAAREKGYKFVWVRNCLVNVRKNETSPAKTIKCAEDLNKIC